MFSSPEKKAAKKRRRQAQKAAWQAREKLRDDLVSHSTGSLESGPYLEHLAPQRVDAYVDAWCETVSEPTSDNNWNRLLKEMDNFVDGIPPEWPGSVQLARQLANMILEGVKMKAAD